MKKFAFAAVLGLAVVSYALAEDVAVLIGKVDGDKITYQKYLKAKKGEKAEKDGDAVTIEVAKDAKVLNGMFNKDTKKGEAGDAIEGGLKGSVFTKVSEEKGARAMITTDDDKKVVTQIMVNTGKKKN